MSVLDRRYEKLAVTRDGDLLRVELADPGRANPLSPAMIGELTALYGSPLREEGIRAVLLSGQGKNFSAGADLDHLGSLAGATPEQHRADPLLAQVAAVEVGQLADHRRRQGVGPLRIVERHPQEVVLPPHLEAFAAEVLQTAHGRSSSGISTSICSSP